MGLCPPCLNCGCVCQVLELFRILDDGGPSKFYILQVEKLRPQEGELAELVPTLNDLWPSIPCDLNRRTYYWANLPYSHPTRLGQKSHWVSTYCVLQAHSGEAWALTWGSHTLRSFLR